MKKTFKGYEISDFGLKNGYVDYYTLSRCFNGVMCNDIPKLIFSGDYTWEFYNGVSNEEWFDFEDVFQWFIISDYGADILKEYTDDPVIYIDELNMFIWCVTFFGTPWDGELTKIPVESLS